MAELPTQPGGWEAGWGQAGDPQPLSSPATSQLPQIPLLLFQESFCPWAKPSLVHPCPCHHPPTAQLEGCPEPPHKDILWAAWMPQGPARNSRMGGGWGKKKIWGDPAERGRVIKIQRKQPGLSCRGARSAPLRGRWVRQVGLGQSWVSQSGSGGDMGMVRGWKTWLGGKAGRAGAIQTGGNLLAS